MFGNPKGEVINCHTCNRFHDIFRKTAVVCACGVFIKSKEYSEKVFQDRLKEAGVKEYTTLEQDLIQCFEKRSIKVETILVEEGCTKYTIKVKRK